MEQFKQLKWSWEKYEEEKNHPPRLFSFETIKEGDVLARTLNEIHKCVVPKSDSFKIFKTEEEIAVNSIQLTSTRDTVEVEDPRKNPTRLMQASHELIKDYGYSSELEVAEQRAVLNSILLRINHNPRFIKKKFFRGKQKTMSAELHEKHKAEAAHFNKCAEIFFYRHISEFNNLIADDFKTFLINRWRKFAGNTGDKFQVITMLLRDQICENLDEMTLEATETDEHNQLMCLVSENNFPSLHLFSPDDFMTYQNLNATKKPQINLNSTFDVDLSLDLLAKLFVDTELFSVRFTNHCKSDGKILSSFHEPMPLKVVSVAEALEEIVATSIHMSVDRRNLENFELSLSDEIEYKIETVESFMRKIYKRMKVKAGRNEIRRVWKVVKGTQSIRLHVKQLKVFYINEPLVPANISVKLEYQTKFGAERMTRGELLKEWLVQKLTPGSVTIRYRVDAKTLNVLSITSLNIEEIENELRRNYSTEPSELLANLVNILACIQRLPESSFLIQTKIESDCKKLFIHRVNEEGNSLLEDPHEISTAFTSKWVPIDGSTPTFLHLNHHFAPCCFPLNNLFRKLSYVPSKKDIQKKTQVLAKKQANLESKEKFKKQAKNAKKNQRRKEKMLEKLNKIPNE